MKVSLLTWWFRYKWRGIVPVAPTFMTTVNKDMLANYLSMKLLIKTPSLDSLVPKACWETAQICTAIATRHWALTAKTAYFFRRGCSHLCWIANVQWKCYRHIALSCKLQSKYKQKQHRFHFFWQFKQQLCLWQQELQLKISLKQICFFCGYIFPLAFYIVDISKDGVIRARLWSNWENEIFTWVFPWLWKP